MRTLLKELLPHAPHLGLFVVPNIPADRLRNALNDFGRGLSAADVLALYDATLLGNGRDGALFTAERVVFQNSNLEAVQDVRYDDLVHVEEKRRLIGGRKVLLDVNRGRATVSVGIDFSGRPGAAEYVARFLREAMLRGAALEMDAPDPAEPRATEPNATDRAAVREALEDLHARGLLTRSDRDRLLGTLGED